MMTFVGGCFSVFVFYNAGKRYLFKTRSGSVREAVFKRQYLRDKI